MPAQARCARSPSQLRRLNSYNHLLQARGPRVPPPHLQAPHPRSQPPQCMNIHRPTVNVPAPARDTRVLPPYPHAPHPPPTVQVRGARVPQHCMQPHQPPTVQARHARTPPHHGQSHSSPIRIVPGTQPPRNNSQRSYSSEPCCEPCRLRYINQSIPYS